MKIFGTALIVILTSLFYFPFNTSWLPTVNTKMMLALVGLIIFVYQMPQRRNAEVDRTFASVSAWALLVSGAGVFSVLANDSGDYTYASYVVTAWVWMGGAYAVIKCAGAVYGRVTLRLLTNILVIVCVVQCILSQIININASFANWVDSFMVSTGFMGKVEGRLYGIGCALDVAGLKFCAVLVLLAYFAMNPSRKINVYVEISLYMVAFFIISIFGSMISRTTSIGVLIVIAYWICISIYRGRNQTEAHNSKCFWTVGLLALVILLPTLIGLYQTNADFQVKLRFGFEGFFSLAEKGEWDVRSNNNLMGMWVWPDNIVTWLIGDGYFNSPNSNPYYIGPLFEDYYMGTDIGYCRFVFYFGLIGLAIFSAYFVNCAKRCSDIIPQCRVLFWLILLINFIGWIKVSSDLFPIFALVLMLGKEPDAEVEKELT